jgi:NtrC-family two-component system response regulator AlgB
MSGLDLLRRLRDSHRDVDAIIITAHGTIETAVDAMKEGALDYLAKPFSPEQVRHRLSQVERIRNLSEEVSGLRRRLEERDEVGEFVAESAGMRHVLRIAGTIAESEATVLITGESGTGKSRLAKAIHRSSHRREGPFVTADCASFHEQLLESELFGHRRGAFTGAIADKDGKVDLAEGGTLFLDEIGEISPPVQAKLLRLVDAKAYERLGDPAERVMDARIVAATNRDPDEMMRDGSFREDLFYRLSVVELSLPPLRQRPEDILPLARAALTRINRKHGKLVEVLEEEVEQFLLTYTWPGNVRELHHLLERAVLLCPGRTIRMGHLPPRVTALAGRDPERQEFLSLADLEENHIREVLASGLSMEEAARRLGIDPSTLWRKRKKLGL